MSTFVFHRYNESSIYKVPSSGQGVPQEICKTEVPIYSIAYADDGGFYITDRIASKIIWKNNMQGKEFEVYQNPKWIRCVRKRRVNGQERIYFLAHRDTTTAEIFYLTPNNLPVSYYLIHSNLFTIPDQCSPGSETHWEQPPDQLAFDSSNNLYLMLSNTTPSAIWKISGAGPDSVTGNIARIYSSPNEPLYGLCCDEEKLYFHGDGSIIYSFDPNTLIKSPFFDTAQIPISESAWDISCLAPVLGKPPQQYKLIEKIRRNWSLGNPIKYKGR